MTSVTRREFLAGSAAAALTLPLGAMAHAMPEPPARPRGPLAMWALTGTLPAADVCRQLDAYAAAGWGVVLYPRWGLELEYLGPAWFDRIRFIVEQAAARTMEVWLYDEFTWPSGHAKGLVTAGREELQAQVLCVERNGRTRIERVAESANLLDREATRRFLAVTHERYAKALSEFCGTTVRAIFTDEPSLASQHRPRPRGETCWRLIWSAALEASLGGDFRRGLEAAGSGVEKSPLWCDYWRAYTRIFHDAWVLPIAQWCRANRIAMSGHLLGEHSFGSQVAYNGSLLRQLGEFGIPGIDEISTRNEPADCEALTLVTIAEFPGRERMAELFALGPPSMHLGKMRSMIDLVAACGVDRYVLAVCPFDLRGNFFKREYLGVSGPQQPWFRECAKPLAEYAAEASRRAQAAQSLGTAWPADEELWNVAGPAPTRSEPLKALTQKSVTAAREALRARLPGQPIAPCTSRKTLHAQWSFTPCGLNSLRLDLPQLTIVNMPATAELSVQTQLGRNLAINGRAAPLDTAPADARFDLSYRRLPIREYLRVGANTLTIEAVEPRPLKFLPALILWGDFAVNAQGQLVAPGAPLTPGDWRSQGYPMFCGTGRYRTTVEFDALPARLGIHSGEYPTRVVINGHDCSLRSWPPFEFDIGSAVRPGPNELVIEITSSLGHLFVPSDSPPVGLLEVWTQR